MARLRKEGRRVLLLTPGSETMDKLADLQELTGGNAKADAEMILRRAVESALAEARELARVMRPIAIQTAEFLPYAQFLQEPGKSFRIGDRTLDSETWHSLAAKLGAFHDKTRRWGWSRARADAFLARIAKGGEPV